MGLFRKGKVHVIAKLHTTDSVICIHSREGKTSSHSGKNTVQHTSHLQISKKSFVHTGNPRPREQALNPGEGAHQSHLIWNCAVCNFGYRISSDIRQIFSFQNNPEDLDPSYKTALDL